MRLVTQWCQPELAPNPAPTAARLAQRGHQVKILTGFPNYSTGEMFSGYRQRWSHLETHGPVPVRRVPLYLSHDTCGFKRASREELARAKDHGDYVQISADTRDFNYGLYLDEATRRRRV